MDDPQHQRMAQLLAATGQPERKPSHFNALAGLLDHYTLGIPAAVAGLNPFGPGFAATREAADRAKSDAAQLYGRDILALPEAFGGLVPQRIPQAASRGYAAMRGAEAGSQKVDGAQAQRLMMDVNGVAHRGSNPAIPTANKLPPIPFDDSRIYYHATTERFSKFRPSGPRESLGPGVYVAPDKLIPDMFTTDAAGRTGHIMRLHVRPRDRFLFDGNDLSGTKKRAEQILPGISSTWRNEYSIGPRAAEFVDALRARGYGGIDHVIVEPGPGSGRERVAYRSSNIFDPDDVRLAVENDPLLGLAEPARMMVESGAANSRLAALVAEHVVDASRHAGILSDLGKLKLKDDAEARAALAKLFRPALSH